MDTGDGGKKTSKNLKSGLFKMESGPGPSSKRWMRSDSKKNLDKVGESGISKGISDGDEKKTNIDTGKGKKRKLFSEENGLDNPSKRGLHGDHTDEVVAKEIKELSNLPGEILVKIIELVPISQWASLESVSRIFQEVMHKLWGQQRQIRLNKLVYNKEKQPHQVVNAALRKFLIRAPNVAAISGFAEFCDGRRSIRLPTIQLLSKFEHLQTIDFSDGAVTARSFAVFLESSASRQSWKSLDIAGGIYGKMKSQNAVASRNQPALKLESLKCNMEMLQIFDHILPPIDWSGLKKLIFGSPVTSKEVLPIIRQCTQVSHLEIVIPECGNGNGQPSYGEFMQAVADLVNLSILKINCDSSVEDSLHDALLVLIQDLGRRGITELSLMDCYCSDQLVDAIIDHLPRLRSLELNMISCTKSSLERLANKMVQLETLNLRLYQRSSIIDGAVVRAIGANMSNLQCLTLYYPVANSEDYASLGNLGKLKKLRVEGSFVARGTIETWARLGFGSCLETLELLIPCYYSPELMGRFFKNMPRLRCVKLSAITNGILEAIGEFCPELVELKLWDSPDITSPAIQSLIDRCWQLKFLGVAGHSEWFPGTLTVGKYRKITFKAYD